MEQGVKVSHTLGAVIVIAFIVAIFASTQGSSKPKTQDCLYTVTVVSSQTVEACVRVVK